MNTALEFESQADGATDAISGFVATLIQDGVSTACLAESLAIALGSMLATAPAGMGDAAESVAMMQIRDSRLATAKMLAQAAH